jgi:uncharacterized coiled-coil protein SlyX
MNNVIKTADQQRIIDRVSKQLELIFELMTTEWNSIVQATAKRFVMNTLEDALSNLRTKLLETTDENKQSPPIVVQRFILNDNQLKLV